MADTPVQVEATEPVVDDVVTESTAVTDPAPTTQEPEVESTEVKAEEPAEAPKQEEATEAQGEAKTEDTSMIKTTARAYTNHRKNKKFDPSILPETDDPSAIRAQVEFYFSDNNLPKDEFLWNLTGGAENKPVELAKIHTFGRMRRFQPYAAIVKALRESSSLVVSGEEGKELVARKHAYDPAKTNKSMQCSVYVKGFGDEQPSTQFDIEAFFAKFDTVKAIRLRRTPENLFKGSVFVEFETEEQAQAFLALDPAPKWQGHDLKIMSKQAYVDEKSKLIEEGKLQPSERRPFFEGRHGSKDRGHGGRGGKHFHNKNRNGDSDDWKARKFEDRKHGGHRGGRGRGRGRGRGGRGGRDRNDENRGEKRTRDDETSAEQPPAKKVDAGPEQAAPAAAAE